MFLLPKNLIWTNKSVNLTIGQVVTMKTTNPVLMLSSEKGKLAGKSGQWTLASSGSLVHLCNEPLHKAFICCFSTWMCLCQINEFPLAFGGNAPDVLKTQCSSQEMSFPSNCPLSLYLLGQRNKDNMKTVWVLLYFTIRKVSVSPSLLPICI